MEKQEQVYSESVTLRVSRELRADLERYAREDSRALANYIRLVLEQHSAQRKTESSNRAEALGGRAGESGSRNPTDRGPVGEAKEVA